MDDGGGNFHSPIDNPYLGTPNYDVHDLVRSIYARDAAGDYCAGQFVPSTVGGRTHIDFIYCTEAIYKGIRCADSSSDAFMIVASDYLPVLVEFCPPCK